MARKQNLIKVTSRETQTDEFKVSSIRIERLSGYILPSEKVFFLSVLLNNDINTSILSYFIQEVVKWQELLTEMQTLT
ncbi:hypothetical protein J2Z64_000652 [Oceanobacillus polygoni]|uniref:Uncharacterized protein n=1 Tax=Oceanobacillus polygoni TaxID=1235259 RepID=A0A9X0YP86_9BACI|nr:hypothetical protein [Oceanobacillus polygoni]